jgi:phage portal protein BeeE
MGILQKITSAVRLKNASPDWGTLERYIAWAFGGGASASGIVVNPQTAMQASTVYACIQVLAQSIAMLPCTLYQQATDGSKKTAINHD